MKNKLIEEAYNGSYYTIIGCGGDLNEWKNGYQDELNKLGIGTISKWITIKGKDMNEEFNLTGFDRYLDDLTILAFNLDGLNIGKLAMFKIRMRDRWFDDIVNNLRERIENYE